MDKLAEIMAHKRREIAPRRRPVSSAELARAAAVRPGPPSLAAALRRGDGRLAILAEFKRRSPSADEIRAGISAGEQAGRYQAAGADAMSVLTDSKYFGGSIEDLRQVTGPVLIMGPVQQQQRIEGDHLQASRGTYLPQSFFYFAE